MPPSQYTNRIRAGIGHGLLLTPGVVVVLHDPEGRLLFVRSATSGMWGLPAGSIEPGESPKAAAMRELMEESGVHCADLALVAALGGGGFRHTYANGDEVEYAIFVFAGRGPEGLPPAPRDLEEVSEAAFFSRDHAPSLALPYPADLLWRSR
jgi:8-oxo-dGTP pyrophosphatase MutT (NUDIX family)